MSRTTKHFSFLKRYDRYAKNVTLTYKKSGSFETSIGGICSILSFLLLFYWLLVNFFYAFYDYGTYTTESNTILTQEGDGSYPLYELDKFDLFIAFDYKSISGLDNEQILRYISFIYMQTDGNSTSAYLPKNCNEIYSEYNVTGQFQDQIYGMSCSNTDI